MSTTSFGVFPETKTPDPSRDGARPWHPSAHEFASGIDVVEFGETQSLELWDLFNPPKPHERTEALFGAV
jgi:hypothetical protein